jgi:gamma-glutamylcyclotransferase (GGCT)/AIG2-like uncharacterized protein YtfP
MTDAPCCLFVYGTLKPGEAAFTSFCQPFVQALCPAIAPGRLYHLPMGYPAMTLEPGWVQGVLLTLTNADGVGAMDEFEAYYPYRPASASQYQRIGHDIYDRHQRFLTRAWVYVMDRQRVQVLQGQWLPAGHWSGQ